MVQLSTVVIAALAIVPALASQVTDFEARDTQDLEVRGTKSTRSFDDFDLEVRNDKKNKKRKSGNRRNRNQNQNQPQRESTGLASSAGRFVGSTINSAIQGGGERRAFFDEEDMEARDGERKRRRRRSRKQRVQAQPQTTEGGEQTAGSTRDLEDFDLEVRFDFEDLDFEARMDSEDLDLEARNDKKNKKRKSGNRRNQNQNQQPQRESTGLSSSAGRFVGSTINSAIQGGGERRAFYDEEDLEARDGERKRRRRRSRKQRVQAQPQTTEGGEQTAGSTRDFEDFDLEVRTRRNTGLSASAGRFVGSTINSAINGREFVDEEDLSARDGERKRRRRRSRKQRVQAQPQTTEGQSTGETREFVDEDFMLEAREIDELD